MGNSSNARLVHWFKARKADNTHCGTAAARKESSSWQQSSRDTVTWLAAMELKNIGCRCMRNVWCGVAQAWVQLRRAPAALARPTWDVRDPKALGCLVVDVQATWKVMIGLIAASCVTVHPHFISSDDCNLIHGVCQAFKRSRTWRQQMWKRSPYRIIDIRLLLGSAALARVAEVVQCTARLVSHRAPAT